MKRRLRTRISHIALAVLVATAASSCGSARATPTSTTTNSISIPTAKPSQHLPVAVTGADGRKVTVTDTSRIVPLFSSITEVVFELGFGKQVVARDVSTTFAQASKLPIVTRAHDVSAESVLALRPTLVLADEQTGPPEALAHLRNVGIPVVIIKRPTSLEALGPHIKTIAATLGVPDAGNELADATTARVNAVRAQSSKNHDRPSVAFLYLRGNAGIALIGGPGSGPDSLIEASGGRDAGTQAGLTRAFTPMTPEAIVKMAPDVLLLTSSGLASVGGINGLLERPGIANTPAGRGRRVITIEDGRLFGFGSRTPAVLNELAKGIATTR